MAHHIEDGRVWAVDQRTGEKRRVLPHILKHSKHLSLPPSGRAKAKRAAEPEQPRRTRRARRVTEPKQPEPDAQPATEPAQESEPDSPTQPATEPGETSEKES